MARTVDTKEYLDMVCALLAEGKTHVPVPVAGVSMTPFLHSGDTVCLDLPDTPLKKADIVLFTRPGGQYILHRITKIQPDGSFCIVGDAQTAAEPVKPEQIRARVTSVSCGGKQLTPRSLRWRFYATVWIWPWVIPLRPRLMALGARIKNKTH